MLCECLPPDQSGLLWEPLLTLCLTMKIPCFALYPKARALSSRVGRSILVVTGSRLHFIMRALSNSTGNACSRQFCDRYLNNPMVCGYYRGFLKLSISIHIKI